MATRMVRRFAAIDSILPLVLAFAFVLASGTARADGIRSTTCISSSGALFCTTQWRRTGGGQLLPWQVDPRETAATTERERKWLARCRPVARTDQYGVSRYSYAAAGCEFGKIED